MQSAVFNLHVNQNTCDFIYRGAQEDHEVTPVRQAVTQNVNLNHRGMRHLRRNSC